MSGDVPSVNNKTGAMPASAAPTASSSALDLGQAVIVSMPKEVLDTATNARQAGRILAEVIAQQGQNATLKTPDGAFIIKTNSALNVGQVVMLRLDPEQLQAQAVRLSPVDNLAISNPVSPVYNVPLSPRLTPHIAPIDQAEPLPQPYWRGQLAPVEIPDDPTELLHVLRDVYNPGTPLEPGRAAPVTTLPPAINEGVAKFFALTQLLREMDMLPPQLQNDFLFAGLPPEDASSFAPLGLSKITQSIQGFTQTLQDAVGPAAKQATEQAGAWLKAKLPSNLLGKIDQLKDALQKSVIVPIQEATQANAPAFVIPIMMSFTFPPGTSLLQVWQNAMQGQSAADGQAPFLLLNMLGLQKPGQTGGAAQSGLSQLMAQFKSLQQQRNDASVIPTLVLPGNGNRNPVLFSPYGLLFSNTSTVLGGTAPLLPGTVIFWQPVANPHPVTVTGPLGALPLWPAGKAMPASVFEWPCLNELFANKGSDPTVSSTWQNLVQTLIPNMLQPDRLGASIVLMLHGLNRNSVNGWLGDKAADALRDGGKQDMLAKLVSDFATSAGRVMDPALPEAQRFVLPLILPEQMAKMVWQVRRDFPEGGERETDAQERQKNTRTHFTVDVPTATLGDLHMQGTVWKQQLDLNLQTAQPLDATMQTGIRERFRTALEITGMSGQIVFNH